MFDKMASAETDTAEPPPRFLHQFHHVSELRELTENKMLERLWKRLTSPFKRTARAVEGLQAAVQASSNASAAAAAEACAASCAAFAAAAERRLDACADASASASAAAARRLEQRLDRTADAAAAEARRLDARLEEIGAVCVEGVRGTSHGSNRSVEGTFHSTDGCGSSPTQPSDPVSPHPYPKDIPRVPEYDSSDEYSGSSGDGELGGSDVEPPFIPVIEKTFARNCEDLFGATRIRHNGIYKLGGHETNSNGRDFYTRFCDMQTNGGGWTVIQRRGNFHGPRQNFSLPWNEYRAGFGDLDKEFWFGNDFIHRLTYQKDMILRVELESFSGKKVWAEYSSFRVGPVESNYRITVGGYTGNATNSLVAHDGALFSTIDKTNDAAPSCCPCAPSYGGGWWFDSCFEANLNGVYYTPRDKREEFRGIIWEHWLGDESLKSTEMKIRPKVMPVIAGKEDPSFEEHSTSMDDVNPLDIPEDP